MDENNVVNLRTSESNANATANPIPSQNSPAQNTTFVAAESESPKKRPFFLKILLFLIPIVILIFLGIAAYFVNDKIIIPTKVKEKISVSQPLFMSLEKSNDKIINYILNTTTPAEADSIERQVKKEQATLDYIRKTETELIESLQDTKLSQLDSYKKLLDEYLIETDRLLLFAEDRINLRKAYKEPIEKHQKLALTLKSTGSLGVTDQERYITVLNDVIVGEQEVIQDLKKIKVKNPKVQESHENFISQLENTVAYIIQIRGIYQSNNVTALLLAESQHVQNKADLIKEANRIGDEIDLEAEDHKDKLETLSQQINSEHARLKGQYNF